MTFLEPWYEVSSDRAEALARELKRELAGGHVLEMAHLKCVGKRDDRDDVLFRFEDGSGRWVCVHLTWQRESNSKWPATEFFESEREWIAKMRADHEEFTL